MLRRWSRVRMQAELGALQAIAERAGATLACVYSSSHEFEAATLAARCADRWLPWRVDGMRVILLAVAAAAIAALAALAVMAI
jgi:hypothetical protein